MSVSTATTPPVPRPGPSDIVVVPTTIRVSRSVKFKKDASTPAEEAQSTEPDEIIEVHRFATEPARVHIGVDMKKNKEFNSAGIMVNVTLPCYVEEIPQGIQKAYDTVMERILKELPNIIKAAYDLRDARIEAREKAA